MKPNWTGYNFKVQNVHKILPELNWPWYVLISRLKVQWSSFFNSPVSRNGHPSFPNGVPGSQNGVPVGFPNGVPSFCKTFILLKKWGTWFLEWDTQFPEWSTLFPGSSIWEIEYSIGESRYSIGESGYLFLQHNESFPTKVPGYPNVCISEIGNSIGETRYSIGGTGYIFLQHESLKKPGTPFGKQGTHFCWVPDLGNRIPRSWNQIFISGERRWPIFPISGDFGL